MQHGPRLSPRPVLRLRIPGSAALVGVLGGLLVALPAPAQPPFDDLGLETVVTGLPGSPVAITHAGDERLFLTLQEGLIVVWDGERLLPEPFLDLRDRVLSGGERGLLSTAFHPEFDQNGLFFVDYTNLAGDTVVARFRVSDDPNRADRDSAVTLLQIGQPFANHNGGQLQFGPDGFLYIGMGDGGSANDPMCNAQRTDTLLGKMLRLDVDVNSDQPPFFGIPAGNPFRGPGDPPDEIWAVGLRNPWRFAFDRLTGDLFIADVGQGAREEVSFQPAGSPGGENYGWKRMEGTLCLSDRNCPLPVPPCDDPAFIDPIIEYDHSEGDCAVVGGYVYRGSAIEGLDGVYFYGDFCTGIVRAAERFGATWVSRDLPLSVPSLSSFGEDLDGELYLASLQGNLFRLTGLAAPPPPAEPGELRFVDAELSVSETAGNASVGVQRVDGDDGTVSVAYSVGGGSAIAEEDYEAVTGTLQWTDGDSSVKSFNVPVLDDETLEGPETVGISLSDPTGGAGLGSLRRATLTIRDDELTTGPCVAGPTTLCLADGRFRVETSWQDFQGGRGAGRTRPLTGDTGTFWFFDPANLEVVVKVIDACAPPFDRFWVFAGGLTNVGVTLTVVDTEALQDGASEAEAVQQYRNPLGTPFAPTQDTDAFATCP